LLSAPSVSGAVPVGKQQQASALANIEVYAEFPPLVRPTHTRWGDSWTDEAYPTPDAVFGVTDVDIPHVFLDEAQDYTWIAYVRLLTMSSKAKA
jgi:hypothetical protein